MISDVAPPPSPASLPLPRRERSDAKRPGEGETPRSSIAHHHPPQESA
jgi:hypothetical protein